MKSAKRNIMIACSLLLMFSHGIGQTPGRLLKSASPAVNPLDPNGDGFISTTTSGFVNRDDGPESEISYFPLPNLFGEPHGDLSSGSVCGNTELVSVTGQPGISNGRTIYVYYDNANAIPDDGDDLLFFRIRCASPWTTGNFGFSILIDTDNALGFYGPYADPNAVPGNPGFEIEVRVRTGGGANILVDNVDGTTSGGMIISYPISTNYQEAYALFNDSACLPNSPVFHDFYVNVADLGLTSKSQIRFFAATSQSGLSVLSGSGADWGGIDDRLVNDEDSLATLLAEKLSATPLEDLAEGGSGWLPLDNHGFTGEVFDDFIQLRWNDFARNQIEHYRIEKSKDGISFSSLAEFDSEVEEDRELEYRDYSPFSGLNFYRLHAVDLDGREYQSEVLSLQGAHIEDLRVSFFPNPTREFLEYLVEGSVQKGPVLFEIRSLSGVLLKEKQCYPDDVRMDLDLPPGFYIARLYVEQNWFNEKIMVYR